MSYSGPGFGQPDPFQLSTMNPENAAIVHFAAQSTASRALITISTAYFFPVRLRSRRTYTKAWWLNGAAVAGNTDVGIYTLSGTTMTRIVASTAQSQAGTNAMQVATTFTTTTLDPGLYYLAISSTNIATATYWASTYSQVHMANLSGCFQTTASSPLPATATIAATASAVLPIFGFSESASI